MDTTFQIQEIKSQIINMKLRIENIEMQNNNMINSTGDQLLMLSFDMFNNGIKTYNLGKKLTMNFDKYFEQINNISNQINNLINSYYLEKQLKMAQQQMAQQQMMQQQMMQQQMMQYQMMKQQMAQPKINDWKTVVAGFKDHQGLTCFKIETEKTLKELFDEYMEKVYGYNNSKIAFIYNTKRIDRNSNTKIKDYFSNCKGNPSLPSIMVI